jgi:hypothetical protein
MKNIIIILLTSFLLLSNLTYSQNWQWANQIGSNSLYGERANVISDGTNFYAIGSFGNIFKFPNDTLQCIGVNDIFVVKYNGTGNEIWAKRIGGFNNNFMDYEDAKGVYDSVNNCIYIAGDFIGSANFGSITLNSTFDSSDVFIAKMDLNGNFIWAKKAGSDNIDNAYVFIQPDGNVLLAGKVGKTATFGTFQIPAGGYFARYDTNGNCIWADHIYSGPDNYEVNISFINSDIIMGGYFRNTAMIDTATLISNGSIDGYITRMDSTGNVKWIKTFGNIGVDGVGGVATDNLNNIFIAGAFESLINLDGLPISNSGKDILIAKFNEFGHLIWARQIFGNGSIQGCGNIELDSDGNSYVIGNFSGTGSFGTYNVSTSNAYDMFITRYNTLGDCLGVRHFGQASGHYLAIDNVGSVCCIGVFLNSITIGSSTFTSLGNQDIFIAKIDEITGVGDLGRKINNQLLIYANPNDGKCNITIPDEFLNENDLVLNIYDQSGKQIQQQNSTMHEGRIQINLESEAKGVYHVSLTNKIKTYNGRIVFE